MAKIISHTVLFLFSMALSSCNLQRDMLYYPASGLPSQAFLSANNMQFWPSASKDYRGFVGIVPGNKAKGTIVVFHGNAGTAGDRAYYVNELARLGYRVLLAEYPGYGARTGALGEDTFVRDAKETLRLAAEQFGGRIYILGESLGCGVAAAAAKDPPVRIDGIILITPWDTLLSVAREKITWLPVRLFMKDTYDTVGNLKGYRGRIIVVGAGQDAVIPIRHAEALYKSLAEGPGAPRMYTIRGAGHNDWPGMVGPAWWKEITDYVQG